MFAATTTPGHHHVAEDEEDDDLPNGDTSRDLRTDQVRSTLDVERRSVRHFTDRMHVTKKVVCVNIYQCKTKNSNLQKVEQTISNSYKIFKSSFLSQITLYVKPAVVAEWSKALSQIQGERMT